MKLAMLAAAVVMSVAATAKAEDWRYTDVSDQSVAAVDVDGIRETPLGRQFWALTIYRPGTKGPIAYEMARMIAHCDLEEVSITFSGDFTIEGQTVETRGALMNLPVPPGSRGDRLLREVCGPPQNNAEKRGKEDVINFARSYMETH